MQFCSREGTERQTLRHNSESMFLISSRMASFKASMVRDFFWRGLCPSERPQKRNREASGQATAAGHSMGLSSGRRGCLTWRLRISFCGAFGRTNSSPKNPDHRRFETGHSWKNWKHWLWIMPQSLSLGTLATAKLHRGRWSPNGIFLVRWLWPTLSWFFSFILK